MAAVISASPRASGNLLALCLFLLFDPENLGFSDGKHRLLLAKKACSCMSLLQRESTHPEKKEAFGFKVPLAAEAGSPDRGLSFQSGLAISAEQGRSRLRTSP